MTVRWKPLLVLSGLFLVIAVVGVVAIGYTLIPRGSGDILPQARAARSAKQYEKALIHYKRALQNDSRNAAIHEEIAKLYGEWAEQVPAEKLAEFQLRQTESLIAAARYGKSLKEPRRILLADAIKRGVSGDCLLWANELSRLEPNNLDARYVLASEWLEEKTPKIPDVKRQIDALVAGKASPVRIAWLKAKVAQHLHDTTATEEALKSVRDTTLPADASTLDRLALLRLRELDALTTTNPTELATRVQTLQAEVQTTLSGSPLAPARIAKLSSLLEGVQRSLIQNATNADAKTKETLNGLVDAIDGNIESLFQKALDEANRPELQVYLSYAEHLRFRSKRDQCLATVEKALRLPLATKSSNAETVLGLHTIAVEVALRDSQDKDRFTKAGPHITKLVESPSSIYQGLGHLFLGSIELENAGVSSTDRGKTPPTAPNPAQQKLRASALNHLKIAAANLPEFSEAQARYGVALVLSQETGLGRQYLQRAMRMGTLEPQYQIWAAWSIVQAGYPEEAEPIVESLQTQVAQGRLPRELEGTLNLLAGEIHQARRSPEDLKRAQEAFARSFDKGETPTPAVQLRLAQIDAQLGRPEEALKRIESLRQQDAGGPAAEHLAVLILQEQDKDEEARTTLDAARKKYPDSDELVGIDAAMLAKAEKPEEADAVLAEFIKRHPDNIGVTLSRAQLLSDTLKNTDEARKLLLSAADRSDNSGPLVQLALLELRKHDHAAVAATIAKIRTRWKEAAIGDLLDAQLALDQNDMTGAVTHFDAALKKDPGNKLVQFWKAQLDSRNGATEEARETLEEIARAKPTKEVDGGLSLMNAAESSLAAIALEVGDPDSAIARLEVLRGGQNKIGALTRADRWQLVTAYSAKGDWPTAKREIASLLNDTKTTPSFDERVRGANFYRVHDEDEAALAQLDYVIQVDPSHPPAVVSRAYILARAKKYEEASALLSKAIATTKKEKPPAVFYLMQAAVDSLTEPKDTASDRAMVTLEKGLLVQPDSLELVHAKYRVLRILKGDKEAIAYVEAKAEAGPKPAFPRMLVEIYSRHGDYTGSERVLRQLLTDNPKDSLVAANLVRVVGLQAIQASQQNKPDVEQTLNDKVAGMIREFRTRFPNDLAFLQAECDLAARRGDLTRATAITQEMDKISKGSSSGPLTRAKIYAAQGRIRETADAYQEALDRNPRQYDVRIMLGQARLKLNEHAEAIQQAKMVLEIDNDQPDAVLLLARATAGQPGSAAQVTAHRTEAIEALTAAIRKNAKFADAYHEKSELLMLAKDRKQAIATLNEAVKTNPDDAAGLALLIQRLSEVREDGRAATADELAEAEKVATEIGDADEKGNLMLAIAVGYHKAGQLNAALPWAKKAASKLDDVPLVHLNYGDLLLSIAEKTKDAAEAKPYFEKAVEQYDLVLKASANSVEAINNKAWILHTHLGRSAQALELANGFLKRVDPGTLPGEFFDTVGSIQEATGRAREAEDSYAKGLRKSPDHPVLNYHMGKLFAADSRRAAQAGAYLEKAVAGRDRLSPSMASDLESVVKKLRLKAN